MDTNIIGMWRRNGGPREPDFRVLAVLDLTHDSHGNASGIGLADLISARLRAKVDWHATYTNCLTAGNFAAADGYLNRCREQRHLPYPDAILFRLLPAEANLGLISYLVPDPVKY